MKQRAGLLQSIPGPGDKTIPQLLAYIGRPERFKSVKALTAFASLTPLIRQPGTSLDSRRGTHPMGHQQLKRALYFPAMVAARYNPLVTVFWNRQKAQNKPGKVIVVACMHKLLAIAFGVLRSGKPFDPNYLKRAGVCQTQRGLDAAAPSAPPTCSWFQSVDLTSFWRTHVGWTTPKRPVEVLKKPLKVNIK